MPNTVNRTIGGLLALAVILLTAPAVATGQNALEPGDVMLAAASSAASEPAGKPAPLVSSEKKQPAKKTAMKGDRSAEGKLILRYGILVSLPLGTYLFAWLSWDWGDVRAKWKWAHEGWFERNTYAGGADKCGHIFSHYVMFRAMYAIFNYTEDGRYTKWIYSVMLPSLLAIGIELGDAFCTKQNGFAYQDLVCGLSGICLGVIMEKFPVIDSFFGFSVEYFPSKYIRNNMSEITKFVDDYSGWKFMINFKLAGFRDMGYNMPVFLRYVMFDIGYYTRGFTKYDREVGDTRRTRNIFIGFSINMAEVVDDLFPEKYKNVAHYVKQPFNYIHIPLGYSYSFKLD